MLRLQESLGPFGFVSYTHGFAYSKRPYVPVEVRNPDAEWHMISQRVRKSPAQAAISGSGMLYSGSGKLFIVKVPGISVALLDRYNTVVKPGLASITLLDTSSCSIS